MIGIQPRREIRPFRPPIACPHAATVFIVDDDISTRESLGAAISRAGWPVEAFASAQDFLDRANSADVGCVVLDMYLPDLNGLELQERLAEQRKPLSVIFMTACGDVPTTVRAMKAGALELLTKPVDKHVLLPMIGEAIERSRCACDDRRAADMLRADYDSLSQRERQVMSLIVSGLLNKQVGGRLGISEITVKAHRGQVMRKMKARSFAQLVIMAMTLRVPDIDEPERTLWPAARAS
jgi:FixJ family two-component response regulator